MIRGKLKRTTVTLDKNKVLMAYASELRPAVDKAAAAWIRAAAAASSRYTGQTWNAFNAMAAKFGVRLLSTRPVDRRAEKLSRTKRYSKSRAGEVIFRANQFGFSITFITSVPQIWYNEFTGGLPSPPMKVRQPWKALEKANAAFVAELVRQVRKIKTDVALKDFKGTISGG